MWKIGDRIKTNRSIHGEMVGTIVEITAGYNQSIYHVRWETSKTGTITVKEVAGRDDRDWAPYSPDENEGIAGGPQPSQALSEAIEKAPNLTSDHTKRAYRTDLAHFEAWRDGQPLNHSVVEEYLNTLEAAGKSVSTINRALAAVRWWARRDMKAALSEANLPPARLIARVDQALGINQVKNRVHALPPSPRQATEFQIDKLLEVCRTDPAPAGRRDTAMILLACRGALKPGELRRLSTKDLHDQGTESFVLERTDRRGWVHRRKLTGRPAQALNGWLKLRASQNGAENDHRPIFLAINKGGRILDHGLSGQALRDVLRKRTTQAELPDLTWEMLRNPVSHSRETSLAIGDSA